MRSAFRRRWAAASTSISMARPGLPSASCAASLISAGLRAVFSFRIFSTAAHRLEVGGTLNGAQLADTQHGARHRALQADRIRDEGPDVRVRLQNQRYALDGGGIGAFAAFDETLFEKRLRVGELRDALAGGTLAAEVVREAFAIGGLREHTGESELA